MNFFNKNKFLFLLISGITLSCVVRLLLDNSGVFVATGICMACLYIYYKVVKRDTTGSHNSDNCYYMGFLFTLVSLIYSLVTLFLLDSGEGDVDDQIYNLIGSFGIALISTVLGILFRILLLQERDSITPPGAPRLGARVPQRQQPSQLRAPITGDISDSSAQVLEQSQYQVRSHVDADLAEVAFKLRQVLTQTIADMNVFRSTIIQSAKETSLDMSKARTAMTQQLEKTATEQTKILSTLSTTATAKLTETVDGITASITNMKKPLDDMVASQIEQAQSIKDLSEKMTDDGEKLSNSMTSILEPLQGLVGNLQTTNESVQSMFSNYDSLNAKLQQSIKFFTDVENQMEKSTQALTTTTELFSRSLAEAAKTTPQYAQQFEKFTAVLQGETEKWQVMTKEVKESLIQAIKKFTQVIKDS